jgi:hypothetical protein
MIGVMLFQYVNPGMQATHPFIIRFPLAYRTSFAFAAHIQVLYGVDRF